MFILQCLWEEEEDRGGRSLQRCLCWGLLFWTESKSGEEGDTEGSRQHTEACPLSNLGFWIGTSLLNLGQLRSPTKRASVRPPASFRDLCAIEQAHKSPLSPVTGKWQFLRQYRELARKKGPYGDWGEWHWGLGLKPAGSSQGPKWSSAARADPQVPPNRREEHEAKRRAFCVVPSQTSAPDSNTTTNLANPANLTNPTQTSALGDWGPFSSFFPHT